MSKHTPGPWQHSVKLSGSENHRGFRILTADGWALADVQPADEDGIEGEANARLIAAAPDLLEALKRIVGWDAAGLALTEDHAAQACAAIAKAEGEKMTRGLPKPVAYKTFRQTLTGDPPVRVPLFTDAQMRAAIAAAVEACAVACEELHVYVYDEGTLHACAEKCRDITKAEGEKR